MRYAVPFLCLLASALASFGQKSKTSTTLCSTPETHSFAEALAIKYGFDTHKELVINEHGEGCDLKLALRGATNTVDSIYVPAFQRRLVFEHSLGGQNLELDSYIVQLILQQTIVNFNHPLIVALNPSFVGDLDVDIVPLTIPGHMTDLKDALASHYGVTIATLAYVSILYPNSPSISALTPSISCLSTSSRPSPVT